jgi:SWIM/SEC-C metal-binding protein
MAKLGSEKRPVIVRVQTQERATEIALLCVARGWSYLIGIEPLEEEDVSDLERLVNPPLPVRVETEPKRNDPCPCGSGKKYKKCCGG